MENKKYQNKTQQMEGLSLGLTGNKIGSRSCAEGADWRRARLQLLLLCCGFGRVKRESDE